jgi:hypothetical protein
VLPITFRQFLAATAPMFQPGPFSQWDLQSAAVAPAVATLEVATSDLDLAWQRYLGAGGFPRALERQSPGRWLAGDSIDCGRTTGGGPEHGDRRPGMSDKRWGRQVVVVSSDPARSV